MRSSRRFFSHRKAFLVGSLSNLQTDLDFSSATSVAPIGLTSKRIVDIVLALSGIILLAPLLIICFVVTWTSSPGPVIFRHKRVGFNGKTFDSFLSARREMSNLVKQRRHMRGLSVRGVSGARDFSMTPRAPMDPHSKVA